ncbi:hypothetical protein BDN72DRAFT_898000 [Pluteus cervinus]|uniref:Uncharacterized protein n=1 Tax=Pluteus cervinus TaxID=181527 RepID=A0ACD3ARL7_9AGAR|nr:hypothetical protein BDN72DRAFT_898000 [Pluteus cervinus]
MDLDFPSPDWCAPHTPAPTCLQWPLRRVSFSGPVRGPRPPFYNDDAFLFLAMNIAIRFYTMSTSSAHAADGSEPTTPTPTTPSNDERIFKKPTRTREKNTHRYPLPNHPTLESVYSVLTASQCRHIAVRYLSLSNPPSAETPPNPPPALQDHYPAFRRGVLSVGYQFARGNGHHRPRPFSSASVVTYDPKPTTTATNNSLYSKYLRRAPTCDIRDDHGPMADAKMWDDFTAVPLQREIKQTEYEQHKLV